jgi:hypothetical protein
MVLQPLIYQARAMEVGYNSIWHEAIFDLSCQAATFSVALLQALVV